MKINDRTSIYNRDIGAWPQRKKLDSDLLLENKTKRLTDLDCPVLRNNEKAERYCEC